MRKRASDAPGDVEIQRALFAELMEEGSEAKDKEELIGRWEELTGLWSTEGAKSGEVLKDDGLFALYLRALAAQAATAADPPSYFTKINEAPTKRAAVLSGQSSVASSTIPSAETSSTPAAETTPPPAPASSTVKPSSSVDPKSVLTPSALITALFSGPAGRGKGGEAKIVSQGSFGSWGSPFGGAAAASTGSEPIRVIVEEAKSPILMRAARFLFVTALYSFLLCVMDLSSFTEECADFLPSADSPSSRYSSTRVVS